MDGERPADLDGTDVSSKYDQLAGRVAERLTTSPPRGRATRRDGDEQTPSHLDAAHGDASSTTRRATAPVSERRAGASVRRGHLVPEELHRQARRRKEGGADRKLTWSDVLVEGLTMLVEHPSPRSLVRESSRDGGPTRLVQATLPIDLDRRFRECYLDLDDRSRPITYEQLWAAAIELWLDH